MTIFNASEKVECIATQSLHYDRYSPREYLLERVDVQGKCGLVCVEELDGCGTHARVLLEPVYKEIKIHKISSHKAIYDRYAIFGDGNKLGTFTFVLNAWVPR